MNSFLSPVKHDNMTNFSHFQFKVKLRQISHLPKLNILTDGAETSDQNQPTILIKSIDRSRNDLRIVLFGHIVCWKTVFIFSKWFLDTTWLPFTTTSQVLTPYKNNTISLIEMAVQMGTFVWKFTIFMKIPDWCSEVLLYGVLIIPFSFIVTR